jgi:hypothetical protein
MRVPVPGITLLLQWVAIALLVVAAGLVKTRGVTSGLQVSPVLVSHRVWQTQALEAVARQAAPETVDQRVGVESRGGSEAEPIEEDSAGDTAAVVWPAVGFAPLVDQENRFARRLTVSVGRQRWVSACGPRGPPRA